MNDRRVLQAIVTKLLQPTRSRRARIKATADSGSLTVDLSQLDGTASDGHGALDSEADKHRAVASLLMDRYAWTEKGWKLATGRLPNGDYVHVMVQEPIGIGSSVRIRPLVVARPAG